MNIRFNFFIIKIFSHNSIIISEKSNLKCSQRKNPLRFHTQTQAKNAKCNMGFGDPKLKYYDV